MKLEDFLAKCPRCGTKLTMGWTSELCVSCEDEFSKTGDYKSAAALSIRIMEELDTRQLIIPKKKLDELIRVLSER